MSTGLYRKLSTSNIKNNRQIYTPFIITAIGIITLYFLIAALAGKISTVSFGGSRALESIIQVGSFIVGLFSIIFLFYTNSSLMKRRKREFALFNILGMEKRHIGRILALESLMLFAISMVGGLLTGTVLYKLTEALLFKVIGQPITGSFLPEIQTYLTSLILFAIIFFLMFLDGVRQMHFSNPAELLISSKSGEKPPKVNIAVFLAGILFLGAGYYLAVSAKSSIDAIKLLFPAIFLVMAGTYFSFMSFSIWLLKLLQKNKKYYYNSKHFTAVSGLLYRMKQNAVGLASICIFSTAVLVLLSSAVCLYIGMDDTLKKLLPRDIIATRTQTDRHDKTLDIEKPTFTMLESEKLKPKNLVNFKSFTKSSKLENDGLKFVPYNFSLTETNNKGVFDSVFITAKDYNQSTGLNLKAGKNEILAYDTNGYLKGDSIVIADKSYKLKIIDENSPLDNFFAEIVDRVVFVLPLDSAYSHIADYAQKQDRVAFQQIIAFDLDESPKVQIDFANKLSGKLETNVKGIEKNRGEFLSLYGGIFFVGIFLGLIFVIATTLSIYYKQLSEGIADRGRYEIMQKVGMSRQEVKASIRSQIMVVFFLPLITAGVHMAFAFNIVYKFLSALGMTNVFLFLQGLIAVYICFAILYFAIYALTSRTYYKEVVL